MKFPNFVYDTFNSIGEVYRIMKYDPLQHAKEILENIRTHAERLDAQLQEAGKKLEHAAASQQSRSLEEIIGPPSNITYTK